MKCLNKKICLLLIVCVCLTGLVACNPNNGSDKKSSIDISQFYGTWIKIDGDMTTTYNFESDGTYTELVETSGDYAVSMSDDGTYKVDGNELTLTSSGFEIDYSYTVTFDGNNMIWDNGKAVVTYKKK